MKNIILLALFCIVLPSQAGTPLEEASAAYLEKGANAFILRLLEGSPIEGEKSALTQANSISQIEAYYGTYQDYDIVGEKIISDKVRLVYFILNYEKGPAFGVATYYQTGNVVIIPHFNIHTRIEKTFPSEMMAGE